MLRTPAHSPKTAPVLMGALREFVCDVFVPFFATPDFSAAFFHSGESVRFLGFLPFRQSVPNPVSRGAWHRFPRHYLGRKIAVGFGQASSQLVLGLGDRFIPHRIHPIPQKRLTVFAICVIYIRLCACPQFASGSPCPYRGRSPCRGGSLPICETDAATFQPHGYGVGSRIVPVRRISCMMYAYAR